MTSFLGPGGEQQDVKLTEQERKLLARLLSDPTYFPVEFRTWLKNYIESAGITVSASQISGRVTSRTGLPPGIVIPCGALTAVPPDALPADGIAVSRATYALLFDAIGTTHGAGDGSTTFNLPDYRDRTLFGVGAAIGEGQHDAQGYGSRGGARHNHSVNDPGHNHGLTDPGHAHGVNDPGHAHSFPPALRPGEYAYSGDIEAVSDINTVSATNAAGTGIGINAATTGIGIAAAGTGLTVGVAGTLQDAPNWGAVVYAITTGQG